MLISKQEEFMSVITEIRGILGKNANVLMPPSRLSEFTCGDCERSDRCGKPPDEACVFRAEQIARGNWKERRQAKDLIENVIRL